MQAIQTSLDEVMSMPVMAIGPESRAEEVLALARSEGVHHFPIVEAGRLVGIVCTCDLEDLQPEVSAVQVAWRHVITLPPQGSLTDAARLMTMHGVGSIVIVDDEGVCGIVTREDLVRADPELDSLLSEACCAACGVRRHLRPGPDGQCLCRSCQARAHDSDWLELGGGD
jgi:CBS-domain-containing membrane protein